MRANKINVYIQDAVRTPRGKARADGGLAKETPYGLIAKLVEALRTRNDMALADVDRMVLGCVGQVDAQGGHIGLISKLAAGLPDSMAAHSINNFCASGLSATGHVCAAIESGQARKGLAGGVEMLSRVPFMGDNAAYYSDPDFPKDLRYVPVVLAADRLANTLGITRQEMDDVALISQSRAVQAEGKPALQTSRIPISGLARDEAVRPTTAASIAKLAPAFAEIGSQYAHVTDDEIFEHSMTVAHAPPMADGAGLVLLGTAEMLPNPRARIVAFAECGGDNRASLLAGFSAMDMVLDQAGLSLKDMDRIEFMEAFAVTFAKFLRDYSVDMDKVNVGGGHLAKGHPMGATGAILLSALLDALDDAKGQFGLVVATGAQGVGVAMIVERLS